MKQTAFALASFTIAAILATTAPARPATALPVRVQIDNYAFKAEMITVGVGTTVVWKNLDDDPHTVTAIDGSFDSKGMAQGDSFSFRFAKAGTYRYYCKVHPFMKGTVIVKESGS